MASVLTNRKTTAVHTRTVDDSASIPKKPVRLDYVGAALLVGLFIGAALILAFIGIKNSILLCLMAVSGYTAFGGLKLEPKQAVGLMACFGTFMTFVHFAGFVPGLIGGGLVGGLSWYLAQRRGVAFRLDILMALLPILLLASLWMWWSAAPAAMTSHHADGALRKMLEEVVSETPERRRYFLHDSYGNADEAVRAAVAGHQNTGDMIMSTMVNAIPAIGPLADLYLTVWTHMREVALIAALYGHDVTKASTQNQILQVLLSADDSKAGHHAAQNLAYTAAAPVGEAVADSALMSAITKQVLSKAVSTPISTFLRLFVPADHPVSLPAVRTFRPASDDKAADAKFLHEIDVLSGHAKSVHSSSRWMRWILLPIFLWGGSKIYQRYYAGRAVGKPFVKPNIAA